jgi:restriction endonuclease
MTTNTGRDYEKLVQAIFQGAMNLSGVHNVDVRHDVNLLGKTRDAAGRQITHQVDVYWEFELAGITYRAAVQAKDWKTRVTKEKVLAFKAVLDDLPGQPRGIMVTRAGYQAGADFFAREHGIELYVLSDIESAEEPGTDVVTLKSAGAKFDTHFEDVELIWEPQWYDENCQQVPQLMEQLDPREAYLCLVDGTPVVPRRSLLSVFENIQRSAISTKEGGPILNWFDVPVGLRTDAMSRPVMLLGISARFVADNRRVHEFTINLAEMFSMILRQTTGNRSYFVDDAMALHERVPHRNTMCDFCAAPVPDDDTNLFAHKRVALTVKHDKNALGTAHVYEEGHFGACDPCAALVREGKRLELWRRAVSMFSRLRDERRAEIACSISHNAFWYGYAGLAPIDFRNCGGE